MKIRNTLFLAAAFLAPQVIEADDACGEYEWSEGDPVPEGCKVEQLVLVFDHCSRDLDTDDPFKPNYKTIDISEFDDSYQYIVQTLNEAKLVSDEQYEQDLAAAAEPPVFGAQEEEVFYGDVVDLGGGQKCKIDMVRVLGTETCPCQGGSSSGDPHFTLWGGEKFDFHGGCDLVLLQDDSYNNGMGLNVHIRTKIQTWWSHIETAVVRLGENTLEITSQDGGKYFLNGQEAKGIETGISHLGDYQVNFRRYNDHSTVTRIDLGQRNAMSIETFKQFVKVQVVPKGEGYSLLEGSLGMLGSYPDGQRLARDGVTVIDNTDDFGQEWMVRPTDPILFHDVDGTNYPLQCAMPDMEARKEGRRRLGASGITEEDAARACSRVELTNRDACIFDVLATNDVEMAGSY